jgi:hypothetical protein
MRERGLLGRGYHHIETGAKGTGVVFMLKFTNKFPSHAMTSMRAAAIL